MRFVKILTVLLLAGSSLYIFQKCSSTTYKNLPPTARGEWIAFGDSLTAGYGAGEGQDYPALLSKDLGVPIRNLGVPGNTTQDGLNRLDQALELQPRVVLLCLGGNDSLRSMTIEKTFANLASIIDRFQQSGSFVVLIGVHSASLRDKNETHFKKLAKEKNAFYIPDILEGVLGIPPLMSDYIHPNEAGYRAIAERLGTILRPLVPRLK
jgi:acyl-CoA thioesterase-1